MERPVIIVRYGEIALKSPTVRKRFEDILLRNIRYALKYNDISHSIEKEWGRIYILSDETEKAIMTLKRVFGIVSVSPSIESSIDLNRVGDISVDFARKTRRINSFAIRVSRVGNHEFSSQEVASFVGERVRTKTGLKVDLDNPDIVIYVEIRTDRAFIYTEKINGSGGLPVGTQGRVFSIIKNKKDVLALWFMLKRGCRAVVLKMKEIDCLEKMISSWYVSRDVKAIEETYKVSLIPNLIKKYRCDAVVVGDSISDVRNSYFSIPTTIPILRPLLIFDKDTINRKYREIGI